MELQNANPVIFDVDSNSAVGRSDEDFDYTDENAVERVTREEVFEFIRHINDPEHPLTLEQLNVVSLRLSQL